LQIINNDYAYAVDGDVFYSVEKCPNYGMLSGQRLEHNRAGERVAVDSRKRHPADFALWKVQEALPVLLTYIFCYVCDISFFNINCRLLSLVSPAGTVLGVLEGLDGTLNAVQ
jgi:hypothetical protein